MIKCPTVPRKSSFGAKKKLADLAEKASIATHSFNSKLEDRKKF